MPRARTPDRKRPTIRDVAARAGVSHQTVSRVINVDGYVAVDTRASVLRAIRQLNYVPNGIARSLSSNRSHTLGVVSNDISDHSFAELAAGAELEARRHGFYLVIGSVEDESPDDEEAYLRLMQQRRIEGLIVARPRLRPASQRLLAAMGRSIPTVAIASRLEAPRLHSVDIDNRGGGRLAAAHLVEMGHRAVATITGPLDWPSAAARLQGTQQALAEAADGTKLHVETSGEWGVEGGQAAMSRLIESGRAFTAVFAQSDLLAVGAIAELHRRGLSVPRDMSVVGYDDIPVARYLSPPLTTVRQPMREVGARAVRLLVEALARRSPALQGRDRHHLVDVSLIVRASVARRPVGSGSIGHSDRRPHGS
ncbi:MAG TPA: LacI family DNA-binding transcriptional regulator [Candidatus Acidoferrales bacterium]|nr:LacI family DNA-binding transcriptional regulator [Candidatus Acidoferrales bacterium]